MGRGRCQRGDTRIVPAQHHLVFIARRGGGSSGRAARRDAQVDGLEEHVMLVLRPRFAALRDRVRLARLVRLRRLHVGVRVKPKRTTMARVRTRARPPTFEPREAFVATLRRSRSTGTTRSSREDAEVGRLRLRARSRRTPRSRSASDRRPRGFARKKPTNRARCRRAGNAAATRVPGPRERGLRGAASAGGLREETRACSDRVDRFASRVLAPTRVALCPSLRSSADFESARDADVTGVGCSEWGNFVAMGSQSHVLVIRRIWKDLSIFPGRRRVIGREGVRGKYQKLQKRRLGRLDRRFLVRKIFSVSRNTLPQFFPPDAAH